MTGRPNIGDRNEVNTRRKPKLTIGKERRSQNLKNWRLDGNKFRGQWPKITPETETNLSTQRQAR